MINRIDHFVITVASVEATCDFYTSCLGFERVDSDRGPTALRFGQQKFNVHQVDRTFEPKAQRPTAGSADFCLVADAPLAEVIQRLEEHQVPVEVGPVAREGALGRMQSIYFRDPDGNLVEVSNYDSPAAT